MSGLLIRTCARRTEAPVSAATTRPRRRPVPVLGWRPGGSIWNGMSPGVICIGCCAADRSGTMTVAIRTSAATFSDVRMVVSMDESVTNSVANCELGSDPGLTPVPALLTAGDGERPGAVIPAVRLRHGVGQRVDEAGMDVDRLRPHHRDAGFPAGLCGLDVQVVEDLDVIAQEADGGEDRRVEPALPLLDEVIADVGREPGIF